MDDQVQKLLTAHDKLVLANANEAETRLKLIDKIVFQVLGWTEDDVRIEETVSEDGETTFADYIVSTGFTSFVIEAKKIGQSAIEVPNTRKHLLNRRLVTGPTGDAIVQAREYGRKRSIPFAVVTNGDRWIVFPAVRNDEITFAESSAILFGSLKSILEEDHSDFVGLLSRDAVISGSLENQLLGRIEDQTAVRRLNRYFTTGFSSVRRNSLYPIIAEAVTTAFAEDIVLSNEDLLRRCYVDSPDRTKYDSRIGMYLAKRENPTAVATIKAMTSTGQSRIAEKIKDAAAKVKPLALLVLGQVGAGKTTFIQHVRHVREKDRFIPRSDRPYPHWVYVDCKNKTHGQTAGSFILERMFDYATHDEFMMSYERCIKFAYRDQIDALSQGPLKLLAEDTKLLNTQITSMIMEEYKEKGPYAERLFSYSGSKSPVFLVIDNIDQFEDAAQQNEIFADALALAQRMRINLVLAMRNSTYVANRTRPILDAFDFDPVQVETPNVESVLSRRFSVAKELLKGKSSDFVAENGAKVSVTDSADIIEMIGSSVLGTNVGRAISLLATGDIRFALRITREFLQHGYTATGKAMRLYQTQGYYNLPEHEALRAIMLGNQAVYSEAYSPVGNPFDARLSMTSAQLLRLFVLNALVNAASSRDYQAIDGTEVATALREIGFGEDIALSVLSSLCDLRFVFTKSHSPASLEATYIPSRLGGFVLRELLTTFVYLENVLMDTFISSEAVWNALRDQTRNIYDLRDTVGKLAARKDRVAAFYSFMTVEYAKLSSEAQRRGLAGIWCNNPLKEGRTTLDRNLQKAMTSAKRNASKGVVPAPAT